MFSCAEVAGSFWGNLCEDRSLSRRRNAIIGWPVCHRGGKQKKDAVSLSAGKSKGGGEMMVPAAASVY